MCQKRLSIISNIVSIAVILTALVTAVRVDAATVTSANDYVSTLVASELANHEVLFTTPSGISEGQTVTLTFGSGFTTTSITEDDVDVADDSTELTTAATCAGSEQASVAIASNIMTLTICAGDGGAIAATSAVRVRIGTNATSSGIGMNRMTNPSSAKNHFVTIGGTFGDAGSIALPVQSSSSAVSVTATIPSVGISAPSGNGCTENCNFVNQQDATPPVISAVVVSGMTLNGATISWTTDENANSRVNYGLTNEFELGFVLDASLVKSHTVSLTGLQEGKMYYFQVKSADQSNNIATYSTTTFNTLDPTAPVLSNVVVTNITQSSATISWNTNENTTSVLDYGLTASYGTNLMSAAFTQNHSFHLSGLQSGMTYHFRVKSQDASANITTSTNQSFATLANLAPTNVAALTILPGDKKLTLVWSNPTDVDFAGVRVLRCGSGFPSGPTDISCSVVLDNSFTQTLVQTGLTNETTYYYGVFSKDTTLQFASGALASGKPSAPEIEVLSTCGDLVCSATESSSSCPADCSVPSQGPVCGDAICAGSETTTTCSVDCAVQTPSKTQTSETIGSTCGNGVCNDSESTFTCAADCKVTVPTESTTPGSGVGTLRYTDVQFSVGNGAVQLSNTNGYIDVLPRTPLSVRVPATNIGIGIDHVRLAIGAETFILRPVTRMSASSLSASLIVAASTDDVSVLFYEADVLTPSALSLNPVTIFVEYENGQTINASSFLRVVAPGVTHEIIDGEEAVVAGTTVTLYQVVGTSGSVWDGSPYSAQNPTTATTNGLFAWYVPNGLYRVRAEQALYDSVDTPVLDVKNNIVNPRILMTPLVQVEETPLQTATEAVLAAVVSQETVKQVTIAIQKITESKPVQAVTEQLETIREIPAVQTAVDASVPTLIVSAGTSVVVMSIAFDFLPFVQYLFTAPVLFLGRSKRKGFGVIYNAISKEPIGLAVVRLYQVKDEQERIGKLVKSRVTDKGGRFYFLVQPGTYRLMVTKAGFQFPTQHLTAKKEDVQFTDLYHGELLRVTEADAVITPNIPIDPSVTAKYQEPKNIKWHARLRVIQHSIAFSGVLLSFVFAIIRPNVLAAAMVLLQIGIYLFVQRLAKPRKPKSWGIVYDKKTGRPVSNVVARIFEPKYNKLLETQVTDSKGRYSFLLGPAEYYAVFEKEGYRSTQVSPIDFSKDKEAKDFSMDIRLLTKET